MEIIRWVMGLGLIAIGFALFWMRAPNWLEDGELRKRARTAVRRWSRLQRIVRIVINLSLIACGCLIVASIWISRGKASLILWTCVVGVLLLTLVLAAVDACSSLMGYRHALPEAAHRTLSPGVPIDENSPDQAD